MDSILTVSNLSKRFKNFTLDGVSFSLPKGYIMGFIGPNGAGKTTTIKLILNMLKKDGGTIRVFGKDHEESEREIKERIGVVMDNPFYVEDWTLRTVGKSLSPFYQNWNGNKYESLLSGFSLDPKKKVKELSRGMKMKLMIAAALSHDADLLILDEPTSGLDAVARNELTDILRDFMDDERKAVLFSTHITADLEKIADYITFINAGKILYADAKDNLLEKFVIVKGDPNALSAGQKKKIIGYREHSVGFDGLMDSADARYLSSPFVTEPCDLDELVVRFNMGGNSNE
jgi:ABC-2 type transport system ATP-binding protein